MENKKNSVKKKICSAAILSMMILGMCSSVLAAPISKIQNIPNNSLVIGKCLFRLDKVTSNEYNLGSFVQASKTVDDNNGIYYKHNGKWYTDKDIKNLESLKKAEGLNTIPNDILKIDGKDVKDETKLEPKDDGKEIKDETKPEPKDNDIKKDFHIIDAEHSCIMNIHYVNYAVVVLKEDNFNDCSFYIDGKKVVPKKVNEEGNIIKIELKDRKDKSLMVESQGKKEEITLKYKNF
ncbi:hypothetical protein [Clostridium tetani]|uniref:hypothetical protein n=1 Tax=Clostridium tetani TaxID=1513 RepID=UPI0005146A1B|nr:hypothetical protein [Clostridium tetani]KGI44900.1 hypothetical protein KY55_02790 [Clostridium tetani]RXI70747.1 hypothetical protein DP127_08970 [Clostridium tetani]BDR76071.1 hypothetical protein K154306013_17310 [Clostridium tetani]BDR87188.1 hypothetical protein N071400001_17960 [Clostridium tetani]